LSNLLDEFKTGSDCASGGVLLRLGKTEVGEDAVAEILRDKALVFGDRC
jgi:hypothetical protein